MRSGRLLATDPHHIEDQQQHSSGDGGVGDVEDVERPILPVKINEKDIAVAKREVYVAITRAKKFCTISYAKNSLDGSELELAQIIQELPEIHFVKKDSEQTETELLANGADVYVRSNAIPEGDDLEKVKSLVEEDYDNTNVSVSLLNNFFECPWKWYFRNFLKLPEIKSSFLLGHQSLFVHVCNPDRFEF